MKKFTLLFLSIFMMLFCTLTRAEIGTYKSPTEKNALIEWVTDNAHSKLSVAKAKKFVATAIKYANLHDLDPLLILSMMKTESGFRDKVSSSYGAKGVLQVVPRWHQDKLRGRNPYDTDVSIEVGTRVLKDCWNKHNSNTYKSLSCYSGGGGKKYYKKVMTGRSQIKRYVIEQQFLNEKPIHLAYLNLQ